MSIYPEVVYRIVEETVKLWNTGERSRLLDLSIKVLGYRSDGAETLQDMFEVIVANLEKYHRNAYSASTGEEFKRFLFDSVHQILPYGTSRLPYIEAASLEPHVSEVELDRLRNQLTELQRSVVNDLLQQWQLRMPPDGTRIRIKACQYEGGELLSAFLQNTCTALIQPGYGSLPCRTVRDFEIYLLNQVIGLREPKITVDCVGLSTLTALANKTQANRRVSSGNAYHTHCWRCGRTLDSSKDLECPKCRTILCKCGACRRYCFVEPD